MKNREWLSTLTNEEFTAWCTLLSPYFMVNGKKELTKYGVGCMYISSSQRILEWLGEERVEQE